MATATTNGRSRTKTQAAPAIDEERIRQLCALLNDGMRLRVVLLLSEAEGGEMHVNAMCEAIGMSQQGLSHHLSLMRVAGVLENRREGKFNLYSIVPGSLGPLVELAERAGS